MNFLTKLFKKKPVVEIPPMHSWETVVEIDVYKRQKKAMIDGVAGSDVKLLDFIEYGGDSTYENGDTLIAVSYTHLELVQKKFEGSLPDFIATFTRHQRLTDEEINQIKNLIDKE